MADQVSRGVVISLLAGIPAAIAVTTSAASAAKATPKSVQYIDKTKNGKKCIDCRFYVAAKKDPKTAKGTCTIVDGPIAPAGWCVAYAPTA